MSVPFDEGIEKSIVTQAELGMRAILFVFLVLKDESIILH